MKNRDQAERILNIVEQHLLFKRSRDDVNAIDLIQSELDKPRPWSDGEYLHFHYGCTDSLELLNKHKMNLYDPCTLFQKIDMWGDETIIIDQTYNRFIILSKNRTHNTYSYIAIPLSEVEE